MSKVTQGLDVCPNTIPDGKPRALSLKKIKFGPANEQNKGIMIKQFVSLRLARLFFFSAKMAHKVFCCLL